MTTWQHALDRTVTIRARRETVFAFFTDSERFAAWWGKGSTIDARVGGRVRIVYPNGVVALGEVQDVRPVDRIVFTYGYEDASKGVPPGGSLVTVTLTETPAGTVLQLRHQFDDVRSRDAHVQGWRYQLAVFANVAAAAENTGLAERVDRFLAAWSEPDGERRAREMAAVATPGITFGDAFSCTSGLDDLTAHLAAAQAHMPGMRLERQGDVRQCQGTAVADWVVKGPDGAARGQGTNVFDLAPDGRIARAIGLWRA